MDYDNIIDIYNLDNLKVDNNYLSLKLYIENDKLSGLIIDDEPCNLNKIKVINKLYTTRIILDKIIKEFEYDECIVAIKIKIYNLNNQISYRGLFNAIYGIYDEQIFIEKLSYIDIDYKCDDIPANGYIHIIIYDIDKICLDYKDKINLLKYSYDSINFDKLAKGQSINFLGHTKYLQIHRQYINNDISSINKLIKIIEISIMNNNINGTIEI